MNKTSKILAHVIFIALVFGIARAQKPDFKVQTETTNINNMVISPDGRYMATSSIIGGITLWDISSRRQLRKLAIKDMVTLSLAFNSDGKLLAAAGNSVSLLDATTGQEVKSVASGQTGNFVFFDSQDNLFVGSERGVKVFNLSTNRPINFLEVGGTKFAVSRNGEKLAIITNGDIEIWNVNSSKLSKKIQKPQTTNYLYSGFHTVALSPDGQLLASGDSNGAIKIWDATSGREIKILAQGIKIADVKMPTPNIKTPDMSKVKDPQEATKIYEQMGAEMARAMEEYVKQAGKQSSEGTSNTASSFAFSGDGKYLASTANNGKVTIWDLAEGKSIFEVKGENKTDSDEQNVQAYFSTTNFSPDGSYIAVARGKGTVEFLNIKNPQTIAEIGNRNDTDSESNFDMNDVSNYGWGGFSVKGGWFGLFTKSHLFWNLNSGGNPMLFPQGEIIALISPDETTAVTLSKDHTLRIKKIDNTGSTAILGKLKMAESFSNFSADGRYFVSAEFLDSNVAKKLYNKLKKANGDLSEKEQGDIQWGGGTVTVWDVVQRKAIKNFKLPFDETPLFSQLGGNHSLLSADGKLFVCVTKNKIINFRSTETGQIINSIKNYENKNVPADSNENDAPAFIKIFGGFDPSGKVLAIAEGISLKLWNPQTGKEIRTLLNSKQKDSNAAILSSIAFSPDGKMIFSKTSLSALRIWSVADGQELAPLQIPDASRQSSDGFDAEESENIKRTIGLDFSEGFASGSISVSSDGKIVAVNYYGFSVSEIKLLDVASRKQLASVYLRGGDWAVLTPDGRFDTNKLENSDLLAGTFPDDPFRSLSHDVFLRDYYEPNLLPRLLAGEKFKPIRDLSQLNRVQPDVKITNVSFPDTNNIVTVVAEVGKTIGEFQHDGKKITRSTGVYDLRLFRDEKLIGVYPKEGAEKLKNQKAGSGNSETDLQAWREVSEVKLDSNTNKQTVTFKVQLPRGKDVSDIKFTAYAFNEDRVKSQTAKWAWSDTQKAKLPKAQTVKRRAYIISFGVNASQIERWKLKYAVNDAQQMQNVVTAKLRQKGQYEVVSVELVSDVIEGKLINHATKQNVRVVLDLLAGKEVANELKQAIPNWQSLKKVTPDDLVILTFSSHGYSDSSGNFFILPYDLKQSDAQQGLPDIDSMISSEELSLWLRYVDAGEMAMIIDACHAAAAVEGSDFKPGPMGSRGLGQLAYDKRIKILAATRASDFALEVGGKINQGLLSYALVIEGLNEGQANFKPKEDGKITLKEWLQYGVWRVPGLYEDLASGKIRGSESLNTGSKKKTSHQRPILFDFSLDLVDAVILAEVTK